MVCRNLKAEKTSLLAPHSEASLFAQRQHLPKWNNCFRTLRVNTQQHLSKMAGKNICKLLLLCRAQIKTAEHNHDLSLKPHLYLLKKNLLYSIICQYLQCQIITNTTKVLNRIDSLGKCTSFYYSYYRNYIPKDMDIPVCES